MEKRFSARNKHIEYQQEQGIKKFGYHVDEKEDGINEDG